MWSTARGLGVSLVARTLIALGILATFTVVVTVVAAVFGGFFGFVLLGLFAWFVELLVAAPRLSTVLAVSPGLIAVGSFVALIVLIVGWLGSASVADRTTQRFDQASTAVVLLSVGCLYVLVVESTVVVVRVVTLPTVGLSGLGLLFGLGALIGVWSVVGVAHRELDELQDQLLDESTPAAESYPKLAETTSRLAHQADVQSPALRITTTDRPESFTLGHGSAAVIVVSTGLIEALTIEELTAVLAHEVSHLANADSRIMGAVLVPVLMADELLYDDPQKLSEYIVDSLLWSLKRYGQFGVAILSRGREWHADAGAVALTGSPGALASALATLSDQREAPSTDLREWEQSVGALDILPPADREHATGPYRTHPSTDDRIERLRQQVVDHH